MTFKSWLLPAAAVVSKHLMSAIRGQFLLLALCLGTVTLSASDSSAANFDVGIIAITSPTVSDARDDLSTVTVTLKNFSTSPVSGSWYNVRYQVDGGAFIPAQIPSSAGTIPAGGTASFTFSRKADLSAVGAHTIFAETVLNVDSNPTNNGVTVNFQTLPISSSAVEIDTFPYFEGFESGAANWTASDFGISTPFSLGTPTDNTINGAASGTKSWKTNLTGDVQSPSLSQVISPIFDLEQIPLVEISLSVWWESPSGGDGAALQSSTDGGVTWNTVGLNGDPDNWYNSATVSGLNFAGGGPGWSGYRTAGSSNQIYSSAGEPFLGYATSGQVGSDNWLTASNTLVGGSKTKLRIVYGTQVTSIQQAFNNPASGSGDDGFAFDNFRVTEAATANRIVVFDVDVNGNGKVDPGDTLRFITVVANNSSQPLTTVMFTDDLIDPNLDLEVGSVITTQGGVSQGNTTGDTVVDVNLGAIASGASVEVQFRATVGALAGDVSEVCAQGTITAAEFTAIDLVTNDPTTTVGADATCREAIADEDGDGLPDGGDFDGDGLTNEEEDALGTDPLDDDTDNDGVNDFDEVVAGTDPTEEDSAQDELASGSCIEWNGFLQGVTQILEQRNNSTTPIVVQTTLFNIDAVPQSTITLNLGGGEQRDLIVNDIPGFAANTYGLLCSTISSGPATALAGQMVNYRFVNGSYDLAYVDAFLPGKAGNQYLSYNTYQPSMNSTESSNFVTGWIQVSLDTGPSIVDLGGTGELRFYGAEGLLLRTVEVSVQPGERQDVDVHTLGINKVGLIEWAPDSGSERFRIRQKRYYTDSPTGAGNFDAVVSIPAAFGSGSVLAAAVDTSGRNAALEVSNTLATAVNVVVTVSPASGTPTTQVLFSLGARSTRHVLLDSLAPEGVVNVRVDSDAASSVIASVLTYGVGLASELTFADAVQLRDGAGAVYSGSYNSFLGQECRLLVANRADSVQSASLDMTRFDGTQLLNNSPVSVPAKGTAEVDLCGLETTEAYGEIQLTPVNPGTLVGVVYRRNSGETVEFSVPVK